MSAKGIREKLRARKAQQGTDLFDTEQTFDGVVYRAERLPVTAPGESLAFVGDTSGAVKFCALIPPVALRGDCPKCGGTGWWNWDGLGRMADGTVTTSPWCRGCFTCKGKGHLDKWDEARNAAWRTSRRLLVQNPEMVVRDYLLHEQMRGDNLYLPTSQVQER